LEKTNKIRLKMTTKKNKVLSKCEYKEGAVELDTGRLIEHLQTMKSNITGYLINNGEMEDGTEFITVCFYNSTTRKED